MIDHTTFKKRSLQDIPKEPTRHGALKRVLLRHEDVHSDLMFLNEVYVAPREVIGTHAHEDMEEIFYILEGEGTMQIEQETLIITFGDCITVPARTTHVLENTGNREMRFVCFGVKEKQT